MDQTKSGIASKNAQPLAGEASASLRRERADEEHSTVMSESNTKPEFEPGVAPKVRDCLVCRTPFPSAWSGERICHRCKSTSAWRSGVIK